MEFSAVVEIPVLVNHTANTACGQLGDICIIVHGEGLGVDDALLVFLVELLEISLCSRSGVVVDSLVGISVNDAAAVVRITVQEEGSVLKAEISPVIGEYLIADICCAVFHCGVCFDIAVDNVEILIESLDLRIVSPLKNLNLYPECLIVVNCLCIIEPAVAELRNDVNVAVFVP